MGLLAGLLDSESTTSLASAIERLVDFAEADHVWSVRVSLKHNPRRKDDT
jgi:hypothetical protein